VEAIHRLTDAGIAGLDQIKQDVFRVADHTDYFQRSMAADQARLAIDVLLGTLDVVGGLVQITPKETIRLTLRLACPGCYTPRDLEHTVLPSNIPRVAELLDELWDVTTDVTTFMGTDLAARAAEVIPWHGARYIVVPLVNTTLRYVEKRLAAEVIRGLAAQGDGMSRVVAPSLAEGADQAAALLDAERRALLGRLPALTPAEQQAWRRDLALRQGAVRMQARRLEAIRLTLEALRNAREQGQRQGMLELGLRIAAKALAFWAFDGPGVLVVGARCQPLTHIWTTSSCRRTSWPIPWA